MSSTIMVERAPATAEPSKAKTFFADADESVVEWETHFKRKPTGLKPGETVAAEVTLESYNGRSCLRVADAPCGADSFLLSDSARDTLASLAGSRFAVLVTIVAAKGKFACHGKQYAIEPHMRVATLPVNPTAEELAALPAMSRIVIEGKVTGFDTREVPHYNSYNGELKWHDSRAGIYIDTPAGNQYIQQLGTAFTYDKGVLENLRKKPVRIGETVRLPATIDKDRTLKCGYTSPYLLTPHPERQEAYDALRRNVDIRLRQLKLYIDTEHHHTARIAFATLRKLELTRHESEVVISFARTMPQEEQPVFTDYGHPEDIEKAYDVNIETLNTQEFIEFTREVLTNVRVNGPQGENRVDQTYLYRQFRDHPVLTDDLLVELISEMLPIRTSLLEQDTDSRDHQYLIETSMGYLGSIATARSYEALASMIELCIERKYYMYKRDDETTAKCPYRLDDLLSNACRAMFVIFQENHDIGFAALANVKEWLDRLEYDNLAEGYVYNELRKLIPWSGH